MPWDCFCPKCKSCVVGGMTDDPEEMEKEQEKYRNSVVECETCGCRFNFDTAEIIEEWVHHDEPFDFSTHMEKLKKPKKREIIRRDMIITFEETEELKQAVYDRVLKFYLDMEAFSGESIMQSDNPQMEAPILLSDIADGLFQFDVKYNDDDYEYAEEI